MSGAPRTSKRGHRKADAKRLAATFRGGKRLGKQDSDFAIWAECVDAVAKEHKLGDSVKLLAMAAFVTGDKVLYQAVERLAHHGLAGTHTLDRLAALWRAQHGESQETSMTDRVHDLLCHGEARSMREAADKVVEQFQPPSNSSATASDTVRKLAAKPTKEQQRRRYALARRMELVAQGMDETSAALTVLDDPQALPIMHRGVFGAVPYDDGLEDAFQAIAQRNAKARQS